MIKDQKIIKTRFNQLFSFLIKSHIIYKNYINRNFFKKRRKISANNDFFILIELRKSI